MGCKVNEGDECMIDIRFTSEDGDSFEMTTGGIFLGDHCKILDEFRSLRYYDKNDNCFEFNKTTNIFISYDFIDYTYSAI